MASLTRRHLAALELHEFLVAYPDMAVRPTASRNLTIEGRFDFSASAPGAGGDITDSYGLKISVPPGFPRELPTVRETQGRIPRSGEYHVNSDGSLCLGSRLRLLKKLAQHPTLPGFAANCLVPYLYAVSVKLNQGGDLPFGELTHGSRGELEDYADLMGLDTAEQVKLALRYLGMKKRRANKRPCPCGCKQRLGNCHFNKRMKKLRALASRRWFRTIHQECA